MAHDRSAEPLLVQLPVLMRERTISTNQLAAQVGVSQSHLSRVLRSANGKTVSGELAERIARAFGLPSDWFPETRQARLFARLRSDSELTDRLYDELANPTRPA